MRWNQTSFIGDPGGAEADRFSMRRVSPHPALARHVEHYFILRWSLPPGTSVRSLVVPTATTKCFIVYGDDTAEVAGPTTTPARPEFHGEGAMVGISFRLGGAARFSEARATDLVDTFGNDARTVLGSSADELRDRVLEARSSREVFERLDEHFLMRLRRGQETSSERHVLHFLRELADAREPPRFANLARAVGISERGLQRSFRDIIGVPPAFILRLARLHRTLHALSLPRASLAGVAFGHGYFDQAHFTNELKALTGFTPRALASQLPAVGFFQEADHGAR